MFGLANGAGYKDTALRHLLSYQSSSKRQRTFTDTSGGFGECGASCFFNSGVSKYSSFHELSDELNSVHVSDCGGDEILEVEFVFRADVD